MEKGIKIAIAGDHAGYELKTYLIEYLSRKGYKVKDFGTDSEESVDYPDFAHPLAKSVSKGENDFGITICGSGNGISMVVNKYPEIRAALCWNKEISKLARTHNNANVCSLPARFLTKEEARDIVEIFLSTDFEGGRHQRRIDKIPVQ
ncbi:MAG: ribose 5-phosphate isomerase B [Bacteroidota bacterium]